MTKTADIASTVEAPTDDNVDQDETMKAEADESRSTEPVKELVESKDSATTPRAVSIPVRTIAMAAVMALLVATVGVLAWLYLDAKSTLDVQAADASNRERAEQVAVNYAVNAAEMDYQDFEAWKSRLVNGTSPELKEKLSQAADSIEQVLAPMEWKSTAKPLATKVRSAVDGVYVVDSFVSVLTKTVQAPDGLQSTATYNITIDSNNDWQITDVGGIDAALGR